MQRLVGPGAILVAIHFGAAATAQTGLTSFNLGCSDGACEVATFESADPAQPFLHLNRPYDAQVVPFNVFERLGYARQLARFPDAVSCLKDAGGSDGYDLLTFDWAAMRSARSLEVCLSRVHAVMPDAETSQRWFDHFGFRTLLDARPDSSVRAGWKTVHVSQGALEQMPTRFTGYSIGLTRDDAGRVTDVNITFNRK